MIWRKLIEVLGVGLVAAVGSVILTAIRLKVGLPQLSIVLGIAALLILGVVFICERSWKKTLRKEYQWQLEQLRSVVDPKRPTWLYTSNEIDRIERDSPGKDIWVISEDLSHDTGKDVTASVVRGNAKRGVRYTYTVPDTDIIRARKVELKQRTFRGLEDSYVVFELHI